MHVGLNSGFANHAGIDDRRFMREELGQIVLAEELGFESIWLTEHHFSDYALSPNPLQWLTYIAGKTKTMRLGTGVVVVPWRDPVRLAEEIAVLDHVSDGRAIIGFGRGLSRREYNGLRIDQNMARQLFDEIVPMVMNALETGYIEGGEIFRQPRREIKPAPFRSLRGRAFCAAGTEASMMTAGKLGLGRLYLGQPNVAITKPSFNPQTVGEGNKQTSNEVLPGSGTSAEDAWERSFREHHPDQTPPAPVVGSFVFVDESGDRAEEMARKYSEIMFRWIVKNYELTSDYSNVKGYESYNNIRMKEEDVEAAARASVHNAIFGDPRTVLEKLDEVRRIRNPQGLLPVLWSGGMPHQEAIRNLRCFADNCLAEVKSWPSAPVTIDDAEFLREAA